MGIVVILQFIAELYNSVLVNIPYFGILLRNFCGYISTFTKKK